jgi:hypothetical protein
MVDELTRSDENEANSADKGARLPEQHTPDDSGAVKPIDRPSDFTEGIPRFDEALSQRRVNFGHVTRASFMSSERFNKDPQSRERNGLYFDRLLSSWKEVVNVESYQICRTAKIGFAWTSQRLENGKILNQLDVYYRIGQPKFVEIDKLVAACASLAGRASAYLNTQEESDAFSLVANLLVITGGAIDSREELTDGFGPIPPESLALIREELDKATEFINQAAQRAAQLLYFRGMLVGASAIYALGLVGVLGLVLIHGEQSAYSTLLGCVVAGCTGAVVSVMTRMTRGTLILDYTMKSLLLRVAVFRPVVGAIFGVVVFMLLSGGLVGVVDIPEDPTTAFYFFLGLAFIAGFSERFAQDMLSTTEGELSKATQAGQG